MKICLLSSQRVNVCVCKMFILAFRYYVIFSYTVLQLLYSFQFVPKLIYQIKMEIKSCSLCKRDEPQE